MNVGEAREELGGLSGSELERARAYEEGHKGRKTILEWLDHNIEARS